MSNQPKTLNLLWKKQNMINKTNTLLCRFQIHNPMKMEFLRCKSSINWQTLASTKLIYYWNYQNRETTYCLPNSLHENAIRICTNKKNLWDKNRVVINRNNRSRSCDILNENGNVVIRNRRHLIPTDEKITHKFIYSNFISTTANLPESVAPLQTTNSLKPVTSLVTINSSKSVAPSGTKITRSGLVLKKLSRCIEQCWNIMGSVLVVF